MTGPLPPADRTQSHEGGGAILTLSLQTPNMAVVELAALLGYDGVTIDLEHAAFNRESVDRLILLARQSRLMCFVRVAAPTRIEVQQPLDCGADGVIIPHIEGLAHAGEVTGYAKYPPLGSRSVPAGRTWQYRDPPRDWTLAENARVRCYPMIETAAALEAAGEIAALPNVDGLFLGPHDLNLDRGRGGVFGDDDAADRRRVAAAAVAAGKGWGMYVYSEAEMQVARDLRITLAALPDDITALMQAMEHNLVAARRLLGGSAAAPGRDTDERGNG